MLLASVLFFWADQYVPYTRFLPRLARKELNFEKFKSCYTKGCLFLFNCFIDISPMLMSPFFVKKKHVFFLQKHVFSTKKWTH